jgi:putative SOS response-associated peptidase YedK
MCGRFALTLPHDAVAGWFDATLHGSGCAEFQHPKFNICPSQNIPVAVQYQGANILTPMRWGFIPHWYKAPNDGPMLINARGETAAEKPAFRDAIAKRRCLIPASGFYEWHRAQGENVPWYFHPAGDDLMAFAGIWQAWTASDGARQISCAMLTVDAGGQMVDVHHREPVVVEPARQLDWLAGDLDLIGPAPDGFYTKHRVSTEVNRAGSDGEELIEPLVD